jgi:hypothetical protein
MWVLLQWWQSLLQFFNHCYFSFLAYIHDECTYPNSLSSLEIISRPLVGGIHPSHGNTLDGSGSKALMSSFAFLVWA